MIDLPPGCCLTCNRRECEEKDLFLQDLRQQVFEFGCGGRMAGLWPEWRDIQETDRDHFCTRSDVRDHCFTYAR